MGSRWIAWALVAGAAGAGCATTPRATEPERRSEAQAREAVAALLAELPGLVARDAGDAGRRLATVWPDGDALADDRLLRAAVRALPEGTAPPVLAAPQAIERAFAAIEAGRWAEARAALAGVPGDTAATARDALRLGVLRVLTSDRGGHASATAALTRLANAPQPGALTRELAELGRLTVASRWLDAGDLKRAIAEFLRVEAVSAHWRAARFGLAMCQLEAGRHESALKVLALLPGGLVAEPERAVVAAMAAHGLALVDEAVAIVDGALARRPLWEAAEGRADEVRAALEAPLAGPREETLGTWVAAAPSVAAAHAELQATRAARAAADTPALQAYEAALVRERDDVIARELRAATAGAARAFEDLAALRPQLR